jgi:hypothetical protein
MSCRIFTSPFSVAPTVVEATTAENTPVLKQLFKFQVAWILDRRSRRMCVGEDPTPATREENCGSAITGCLAPMRSLEMMSASRGARHQGK